MICPQEPPRERVKVSHVVVECRVINHHPRACALLYLVGVSMFHVFNLTIVGQSGEKVFLKDFLIFNYAYILITYIFDLKVGFL